ncbi:murein hydrolase activator EnvC family protein [Roseivivax sp. CAU 1761]
MRRRRGRPGRLLAAILGPALAVALAGAAPAADAPGEAARRAAEALSLAGEKLAAADGARDRVKALTETIRAYEDGLAAMRDGLRAAAVREDALRRELAARDGEVAQLLGALQAVSRAELPEQMLHPAGPLGTARAGMLVASVTPALAQKAQELRADLEEVALLRSLQESAVADMKRGLTGVQDARTELSQAIAERTELPTRFYEDPIRTAILIAATETLDAFASGLSEIALNGEEDTPLPPVDHRKGALPLPVAGEILRRAGEADAAGVERPGIVLATRPQALVTTPVPATIRYRGPLLDYGLVMILEPQPDLLFVLAGLDTLYGEIGEVLSAGAPVGLMGGTPMLAGEIPSPLGEGALSQRSETLYMEVREGAAAVDPMTWFATGKG